MTHGRPLIRLLILCVVALSEAMRDSGSKRRRFLAATAAVGGALGVAGCLGEESGNGTGGNGSGGGSGAGGNATGTPAPTPTGDGEPVDISFEAPHGATIEATAYGDGDCGVVLVPQVNQDRGSWQHQAMALADMGHLALAIDEDPDDRPSSVRGAIRYLREEVGVSTVVLVGASSGGEAVVVANAETDATVDGTVTLSAAGGAGRASELQGRTLFVVATGDEARFVATARELHEKAPEPTELVEYDGSAHGQGLFDSAAGDDLRGRLESFLSDVCGG